MKHFSAFVALANLRYINALNNNNNNNILVGAYCIPIVLIKTAFISFTSDKN